MADASFDILFAGELTGETSESEARLRLQQRFKLSDDKAAQLFSGQTVTIKRGVDAATVSRYLEIFRYAGAQVQVHPAEVSSEEMPRSDVEAPPGETVGPAQPQTLPPADSSQEPPFPEAPDINIGHLSLVTESDWTLEDCQPPLPPIRLPDISYLELVIPDDEDADEADEDQAD